MAKKKSLLPDRKNAPKKTGKRLPSPLDPVKDFDTPTRKEPPKDEQPELLEVRQEKKPTVVKDRVETSYLKPIFSKAPKTGDKLISLQMSLALTQEHKADGVIPKDVMDGWKFIGKRRRKNVSLIDLPAQTIYFYLTDIAKEEVIFFIGAKLVNVTLAIVQKKGEGEALKVTRFSYRIQLPFSRETAKFAESNYGSKFWVTMKQTDEKLLETDDEEESEE